MLPVDPHSVVDRLVEFQAAVRDAVTRSRTQGGLHEVNRESAADTIYQIDTIVEPLLEDFCRAWAKTTPLILIAEGLEEEGGVEGMKVYPEGTPAENAAFRLIVDPIDGTRGIMYDKRAAWALAAVAPNKGPLTRLRHVEVSVMTELPTSKMGFADVLWAVKGRGAHGKRVDLTSLQQTPLALQPSGVDHINHGFATVCDFFPGTKVLAAELVEYLAANLADVSDETKPTVFNDQYISTGGQFYELIVGHDRFNADLRPFFHRIQRQPQGLCCHPYDCGGLLIAEEAGVIVTDGLGKPLDGPLDVTTGLSWAAFANQSLQRAIEPLLTHFLNERLPA